MKRISIVAFAAIALLMSAASAWAGDNQGNRPVSRPAFFDEQVLRATDVKMFTGETVPTGDVVRITLAVKRPVVVSYSIDMFGDSALFLSLKVNGGECTSYGPVAASLPPDRVGSTTLRWVVSKEELALGTNSFEVCVGGVGAYDLRTLTVERVQ